MQNCPLEATQIAPATNAQNCKKPLDPQLQQPYAADEHLCH